MGMPLGPSTQVSPFTPLPRTQSTAVAAPTPTQPFGTMRQPGTAYGLESLRSRISDKPYEPPFWAKQIMTVDPLIAGSSAAGLPERGTLPGFPERINLNPFGDDPVGSFLGGDAGVAMGMVPGQQRGGAYHGIATAPVTLANFSTWGREGLLALATSALGRDYQQPENATFGEQPTVKGDSLDEMFVKGAIDFGNLVWSAMDAPLQMFRNSNAFNRGKNVRQLFATGQADGFLIERVTSAIFGGTERFTLDGLRAAAARQGIDPIEMAAKLYDLSPQAVAAIAANPEMTDAELGTYTDGSPLSVDPTSNLLLEGGLQLGMLALGGAGVAKGAALLGKVGVAGLDAFGAGLRGAAIAESNEEKPRRKRRPFSRFVSKSLRRLVIERCGHQCSYCRRQGTAGRDPDGEAWHIEHVVPVERGGPTHVENLTLACRCCNLKKGTRPAFAFILTFPLV